MNATVCKFGGSSLASASQIRKMQQIVADDTNRRFIVPSAPGKRHDQDQKITDLLYLCHEHARQGLGFQQVYEVIAERYRMIADELGVTCDLDNALANVQRSIAAEARAGRGPDFAASRGEYLNALIIAKLLDLPMIDAGEVIFFNQRGRLDEHQTYRAVAEKLAGLDGAVIPGFYGSDKDGYVKTFSRGGSDVTGSIIARGVRAAVYENWTDVSGLLMADPRIVPNPRAIDVVTYRELRELSYSGASVLHDEAVFPVRHAGIPVNIRNTNDPDAAGTQIVASVDEPKQKIAITGIAGRKDFTVINIDKAMMNAEVGFGRRVLAVLGNHEISFEHMPSSIDTLSVVVADSAVADCLDELIDELTSTCEPDAIEVDRELALIATVGRGMASTPGMAGRLFGALGQAGVNIRMIDQGSSELNIIVGVNVSDYETAVRAIYDAFVN